MIIHIIVAQVHGGKVDSDRGLINRMVRCSITNDTKSNDPELLSKQLLFFPTKPTEISDNVDIVTPAAVCCCATLGRLTKW